MKQIGAWIRNPVNNWFKGQSKRSALFRLFCEAPETCDLYLKDSSCLHCGALTRCQFGSKQEIEGPTRAARSFSSTLAKWKADNLEFIDRLKSLTAYNRIFRANGHFYFPYSWMSKEFMGPSDAPLASKWVAEVDMTTELLGRLCTYRPSTYGGYIASYQEKEVPKFISDLHIHYPEIFALLPDDQKARIETISYVGRKVELISCLPGPCLISKERWIWDGEYLTGGKMLFQPVKGTIEIKIKPDAGEAITVSDNAQVGPDTKFLD